MPSQIKWLQLFPSFEDLLRKEFRTLAALAFLSICQQIGNLNFARRSRPLPRKGRGHPPSPTLRRTGRPRLAGRRRASFLRSKKSSEIGLTGSPATLSSERSESANAAD